MKSLSNYLYLEACRKRSEHILVFGEKDISRSASAVIAYLIKYKKWTVKVLEVIR